MSICPKNKSSKGRRDKRRELDPRMAAIQDVFNKFKEV